MLDSQSRPSHANISYGDNIRELPRDNPLSSGATSDDLKVFIVHSNYSLCSCYDREWTADDGRRTELNYLQLSSDETYKSVSDIKR